MYLYIYKTICTPVRETSESGFIPSAKGAVPSWLMPGAFASVPLELPQQDEEDDDDEDEVTG